MNNYEAKIEAKRERYAELSQKAAERSDVAYNQSRSLVNMIPFGQPILVGHHSEKRHRRDIERINSGMRKSIEEDKKSEYYAKKAEGYGTHGISSDDPAAVEKLEIKLAKLEDQQKNMKELNAEARALKMEKPYAAYQLSNNNAVIRNTKQRIKQLSAKSEIQLIFRQGEGWKMEESLEENRIMFIFESKPNEETRTILKSGGFKWSPTRSAWVRMITNNGRYSAKHIIEKLIINN